MDRKTELSKMIKIWGISLIIFMALIFTLINFYFDYHQFKNHKKEIRENYISQQKKLIKQQVLRTVGRIHYLKATVEENTKNQIKERVDEAYSIMDNIYQNNKNNKTKLEIQKMIIDALRPIRFNNGKGYYFIKDNKGNIKMFPTLPVLEGKNIYKIINSYGKNVAKTQIASSSNKEGFTTGYWPKLHSKSQKLFKKTTYIRVFKPLNWTLGSALYIDDIEKSTQDELLNDISRIRFGENGYVFVNTFDGKALVANGKRYSGTKKLWEIFNKNPKKTKNLFHKELIAAKKPDGDYIYYSFVKLKNSKLESPKASFIFGIPEWKWLIGAGVYLDDVEKEILVMQKEFKQKLLITSFSILILILLEIFIFIIIFSKFSKKISNDFLVLISFLKKANKTNKPIERGKIIFKELDLIAENANKMLFDKIAIEEDLRNEKERLFVTIRSIGDGVVTTDTKGEITLMNVVAENMTGYKTEEAKGQKLENVFKIYNAFSGKKVANPVEKVLKYGKIIGLANHTKLISKNGEEYQIADSASPIFDSQNNILGVILVFRDVTTEYKLKTDIKNNELKFQTIIEQSPISTQVFDKNGLTLMANKAWENLWNLSAKNIIGKYNALEDENVKDTEWLHLFKKAFEGETVNLPDLEYDPENVGEIGRKRIIKCLAFPIINDENKVEMVVLTHKDITDIKQAEEKMQMMSKLKSVGTLAGGIAHDFNNILTGIFGNISLARMYTLDDSKVAKYLINAEKSMNRAIRLTKQLLVFSKGGSPIKEDISIKEIVREVATFDLSGSNVKPIFKEANNLWKIKADKGQIQQVFSNLVINADQAMPHGGHIYFSLENIEIKENNDFDLELGKYVKIMVRDEGSGIDKKHLKKIFDPYFTTKSTGNGLGLATTYSIIQKHNGFIGIDSEIGKGTTFTIYLPATDSKQINPEEKSEAKVTLQKSAKILVMDDEEQIRKLALDMISLIGFEAEAVSDGQEAIEKYKKSLDENSPFDVIIMDLTIPGGMGGAEAIKHILKINPEAKIIVSSGYSSGESLSNYKDLGFKTMIAKPYTIEKLQEILTAVL